MHIYAYFCTQEIPYYERYMLNFKMNSNIKKQKHENAL